MRISISDFLTQAEIKRAATIYATAKSSEFARRCAVEIIEPVITRINETLGQENDPRYLAYMVEYTFSVAKEQGKL